MHLTNPFAVALSIASIAVEASPVNKRADVPIAASCETLITAGASGIFTTSSGQAFQLQCGVSGTGVAIAGASTTERSFQGCLNACVSTKVYTACDNPRLLQGNASRVYSASNPHCLDRS